MHQDVIRFPLCARGLRVTHKFGGAGTIVIYGTSSTQHVPVVWDKQGQHPSMVPASSLNVGSDIPFSDVYRTFSERAAIFSEVHGLLQNGSIEAAKDLYTSRCGNWWDKEDFEKQILLADEALQKRIADEKEREKKRLAEELRQQRNHHSKILEDLLRASSFTEADKYREKHCAEFWPSSRYFQVRARYVKVHEAKLLKDQLAQREREKDALRQSVASLLKELDVEAADQAYEQCKAWWSRSEYEALRADAMRIRGFVCAYPGSSLLELDALRSDVLADRISADDYTCLKLPKLRLRLARIGMMLDEEQLLACARPEQHRLIRARAGSGKTRTLAAHAALSIHDQALDPDQVLILAFNKKAAQEIGDRVREAAGITEFRNARTFHSLAWQLADHAGRELIFDDGNLAPSRRKQSGFVERLIRSIMNPAFRERLYDFFRRELEQLDRLGSHLSREEYVTFRRALADYTLGGETVKSNGEKFIADFLFEHGIDYKYEKVWSWDKQDRLHGTPYRPDFSIIYDGQDVVIEHWAINPDDASANVPDWWETSTQDYLDQIHDKREYWAKRRIALLETHSGMLTAGREAFEASLRARLERAGIQCRKLEHDVLVQRVAEAPRTVSRMAELFLQFISRAKKRGWKVDDVAKVTRENPDPEPRNRAFHELAIHAYAAYERQLAEQSAMDFDDLLISAAECVKKDGGSARLQLGKSNSIAIRDLRWILIDEFQDFSELYYQLISAILETNPSARVVAVGDDWQAINGFAGAQPTFFNCFGDYFPGSGAAIISTNRRSGRIIVTAGNQVMEGRGEPALAHHGFDGEIDIVPVDKVWLDDGSIYLEAATSVRDDGRKSTNWELAKALKACVDYVVASVYTDPAQGQRWMPSILILARTSHAYGVTLAEFGRRLEQVMRRHPDLQKLGNDFAVGKNALDLDSGTILIDVMTAHKAKGKEADTVIVMEAVMRQFPKVHADNQLYGLFGVTAEDMLAEERRLFYVATTRAKHRLMLLTETGEESPYLVAMQGRRRTEIPSEGKRRQLSAEAQALRAHLDRLDQESLIRQNVSQHAVSAWDRLAGESLGSPEIGYSLSQDLYAELAWPNHEPPIAVLTGRHTVDAKRWRQEGWKVEID